MNKYILGGAITLVAVIIGAGVVSMNNSDSEDQTASTATQTASDQSSSMQGSGGFMSSADMSIDDVQTGDVAMDIKDFAFSQKTLKIKKGTTVTWTNQDDARHDVTPDTESEAFTASKLLGKGESYSFTFNTAGTYSYICSPHPYMKASVEVVE